MPRRVSLPGADELFRSTGGPMPRDAESAIAAGERETTDPPGAVPQPAAAARTRAATRPTGPRSPSRRERHEEKITVYVSPEELVDLEHARLMLRADHGLGVDRGRIVREALAVVLADFEAKGDQSILVRRLRQT
ncbi:MAG TPA: cobyrinic acid a,c-diamide synthase [Mycobacteriales bacterium]|jgi:hypothetical protein|nr:cobyrinic acid a,c-diamide synthase [Mycobacteriales bacterium]